MMTKQMVLVPATLPEGVLRDFVFEHYEGATGEDAWALLLSQVGAPLPTKAAEEQVVQIKEMNGEPVLYFPGTPKTEVKILLSQIATLLEHSAPFASETLKKAVADWKKLKATGTP